MKYLNRFVLSFVLIFSVSNVGAEEIIEPLIDGMVLDLNNSVQHVQVRVKSIGPGFCGTIFTLANHNTEFLAPPLVWSDWINLEPMSIGDNTMQLRYKAICDTGVIAEVKYSK